MEVMLLVEFICWFVCLQNDSKSCRQISIKFSGNVDIDARNRWLKFGGEQDHCLHPGTFNRFFYRCTQTILKVLDLGGVLHWLSVLAFKSANGQSGKYCLNCVVNPQINSI